MTAKHEAELEVENRMLREQVASLEKIIAGMQPVVHIDPAKLTQGCAPYPYWPYWHYWAYPAVANPVVTWTNTIDVSGQGNISAIGGTSTVTGSLPEGSTAVLC